MGGGVLSAWVCCLFEFVLIFTVFQIPTESCNDDIDVHKIDSFVCCMGWNHACCMVIFRNYSRCSAFVLIVEEGSQIFAERSKKGKLHERKNYRTKCATCENRVVPTSQLKCMCLVVGSDVMLNEHVKNTSSWNDVAIQFRLILEVIWSVKRTSSVPI